MTTKELIEKLQSNKVAWTFLSLRERACMRQANNTGQVENLRYDGGWGSCEKGWAALGAGANEIWRIKPGYKPEPEYVDLPVENKHKLLCVVPRNHTSVLSGSTAIHKVVSIPTFVKFWVEDTVAVCLEDIATMIHAGTKVYARFRRE